MDSLTHLVFGATLAAAIAPARHRRAALLAGAALNSLPDLDVPVLALLDLDPVAYMTWHRGPSHSLLLLPWVALALWAWLRRQGGRVAESPRRWLAVIMACVCTHPLLDAFTIYGTQLLWPLPLPPAMWSSVFIIDPLLTLPLLLAVPVAAWLDWRPTAQRVLVCALALSTVYLGWSLLAKALVERQAEQSLAAAGLADAPRFSVPMPFNTLLWRVVVMTPDGFLEGQWSLVADKGVIVFRSYPSDTKALRELGESPAVRRLIWFTQGFVKAEDRDGQLVLSDLRMGAEPDYSFRFAVAERDGGQWRPIPVEQLRWPWEARRRLPELWHRIWTAPTESP